MNERMYDMYLCNRLVHQLQEGLWGGGVGRRAGAEAAVVVDAAGQHAAVLGQIQRVLVAQADVHRLAAVPTNSSSDSDFD